MGDRGKRSLLTTVSAAVLSAFAAQGANAQDAGDELTDVIVVQGLRSSLQSAADAKRNAGVIVDSIVAEDVGKFPDTNVAESLQRISGVAIDRSAGEGQRITVRGFGPEFNTVLVNGRRSATPSNAGLGAGLAVDQLGATVTNRGFNFDVIAAELIGGADVYKTTSVALQEGGIGSTINLKTLRPLDLRESKVLLSARGTFEPLADSVEPSLFGFANYASDDGTFGALVSVSWQNRDIRRDIASTDGFIRQAVADGEVSGFADAVGNVAGTYFFPRNFNLIQDNQERERLGITGTAQWRPNDQFEVTVDALYSDFQVNSEAFELGQFYVPNNTTNAVIDDNNTLTSFTNINRVNAYVGLGVDRPSDLLLVGGNAAWTPNDSFKAALDVSYSTASDTSGDNGGGGYFTVIRDFGDIDYINNGTADIPVIASSTGYASDINALNSHFTNRFGDSVEDDIFEVRLDAAWTPNAGILTEVRFGGLYSMEDRSNNSFRSANACFNCGDTVPIPAGVATPLDFSDFLSDFNTGGSPTSLVQYDALGVIAFYESQAGLDARDANLGDPPGTAAGLIPASGYDAVLQPSLSFDVSEDIFAFYAEAQFDGEIASYPWTLNGGLRYVRTEVEANGQQIDLLDLLPIVGDPTELAQVFTPDVVPISGSTKYDHVLPSVNLKVSLQENLIFRFAYSKTLTRPPIANLAPSFSFPAQARPSLLAASAGNPALNPFESENFDVSLEFYYDDASFFSVGGFTKSVDGFIVNLVGQEVLQIANSQNITNVPLISGTNATFNVTRPQNLEMASVEGVEIAWQHTFSNLPAPWDGLGVQANAIFVDSNATVDTSDLSGTFALAGLGDSRNFVVFYENSGFTGRVAYNMRDSFLRSPSTGPGGEPAFVDSFNQLDFRLSYDVMDNVQVFVDGVNVLGEEIRQRGRFENHFLLLEETGARYSFGARVEF